MQPPYSFCVVYLFELYPGIQNTLLHGRTHGARPSGRPVKKWLDRRSGMTVLTWVYHYLRKTNSLETGMTGEHWSDQDSQSWSCWRVETRCCRQNIN